MPVINIDGVGGELTKEQKADLIKKVTEAASEAIDIPESAFTVLIKELGFDNIGSGGKLLSEILEEENRN